MEEELAKLENSSKPIIKRVTRKPYKKIEEDAIKLVNEAGNKKKSDSRSVKVTKTTTEVEKDNVEPAILPKVVEKISEHTTQNKRKKINIETRKSEPAKRFYLHLQSLRKLL